MKLDLGHPVYPDGRLRDCLCRALTGCDKLGAVLRVRVSDGLWGPLIDSLWTYTSIYFEGRV
jgi:hypothetical protein